MHTAQAPIPPAATATHGGLAAGKVGDWGRRASQFPLGPHTAPDPFELAAALAGVRCIRLKRPSHPLQLQRTADWRLERSGIGDAVHLSFR
ncbi:MAG: hypothetical protein R3A44_12860 [Caldilineaceae bacterium]